MTRYCISVKARHGVSRSRTKSDTAKGLSGQYLDVWIPCVLGARPAISTSPGLAMQQPLSVSTSHFLLFIFCSLEMLILYWDPFELLFTFTTFPFWTLWAADMHIIKSWLGMFLLFFETHVLPPIQDWNILCYKSVLRTLIWSGKMPTTGRIICSTYKYLNQVRTEPTCDLRHLSQSQ